jgi:brefeldin A-inhibited guanine nucleotide-exchange protein
MVGTVFERVKTRIHMKEARNNLSKLGKETANTSSYTVNASDPAAESSDNVEVDSTAEIGSETTGSEPSQARTEEPKLTLKDLEHRKSFDDSNMGDGPTMVTQLKPPKTQRSVSEQTASESNAEEGADADEMEDEVYIRDAYLVFRSFCILFKL